MRGAEKLFALYPVSDGLLTGNHSPGPSVQVYVEKVAENEWAKTLSPDVPL